MGTKNSWMFVLSVVEVGVMSWDVDVRTEVRVGLIMAESEIKFVLFSSILETGDRTLDSAAAVGSRVDGRLPLNAESKDCGGGWGVDCVLNMTSFLLDICVGTTVDVLQGAADAVDESRLG